MREQLRAGTYRWLTPVWPMTAVGVLVGAVAGGLAAPLVDGGSPTATVVIRIDQPVDANQIVTNSIPSPESQQAYLAGEIVYLSSSGFATAVGNDLNLPTPPALLATQQGQSTLVQITATEPTADEATSVLDRALKVYAGRVAQLASDRTGAAIDAITAVIIRVRAETLADAQKNDEVVDQHALDDKLRELEQQRLSLQSQQLRAPGIQVIEPITAQPAQSEPLLPIVGGGMLGGLLALTGSLAWRRRSGVIASVSHVDRQISPVLLPVVRLGKRAGSYARSELSRARTLYGQLPAPRTGEILVVGASSYSGTEVVAQLLYMGAMEHVSVTSMSVVNDFAGLSAAAVRAKLAALPTDEGKTVIIDGGSVATAPQMLGVAERAGQIIVVVRIGRDVAEEVEVLLHAIRNEDVPVTAICTKGKLATSEGAFPARRKRSDGGRHSLGNRAPAVPAVAAAPIPAPPVQAQAWPGDGSGSWVGQQVSWADQQVHEDEQSAAGTPEEPFVDPNQTPAVDVAPEHHDATPDTAPEEPGADDNAEAPTVVQHRPDEDWAAAIPEADDEQLDASAEVTEAPAADEPHTNGVTHEAISETAPEAPLTDDHAEPRTVEHPRPHEHWVSAVFATNGEQNGSEQNGSEHREAHTNGVAHEAHSEVTPEASVDQEQALTPDDEHQNDELQNDEHQQPEPDQGYTNGVAHEADSDAAPESPADENVAETSTVVRGRPHEHWVTAIFARAHAERQNGEPVQQTYEHDPLSANGVAHDSPIEPTAPEAHDSPTEQEATETPAAIEAPVAQAEPVVPAAPTVVSPTAETRSFGTGVPQHIQLRRDQVQAQQDLPREDQVLPEPQPEPPAEPTHVPVAEAAHHPAQSEVPTDESGHKRPWLSLLRRKPLQDEPHDEVEQQTQGIPENQNHTHA